MRSEVAALTSDLHHRDNTLAVLSQKLASAERNEREESQKAERHQHELQVSITRILYNIHLYHAAVIFAIFPVYTSRIIVLILNT